MFLRLRRLRRVFAVGVALENRVDDLAELAAVQLGGLPSSLAEVLDDLVEGVEQLLPQSLGKGAKHASERAASRYGCHRLTLLLEREVVLDPIDAGVE